MGEYEEFLKTLPKKERVSHFGLDKRLDFLGPKIVALEETMGAGIKKIEQIPFSYLLTMAGTPTSGVTLTEKTPFSGYIKEVTPHWPAGCNALVDIMVGHGVTQFCPREGFLALDGVTPTYPFNIKVEEGDPIWVQLRNRSAFPHQITVTLTLYSLEGAT